jgi:hypothetical protein
MRQSLKSQFSPQPHAFAENISHQRTFHASEAKRTYFENKSRNLYGSDDSSEIHTTDLREHKAPIVTLFQVVLGTSDEVYSAAARLYQTRP